MTEAFDTDKIQPENNPQCSGIEHLRNISTTLETIEKHFQGDKIFTLNTLAHVVLPAVIGAICGIFVSIYGFGFNDIRIENSGNQKGFYPALFFTSSALSLGLTLGLNGIPNNGDKRIKSWTVAIALAFFPGVTVARISKDAKQIAALKQKNYVLSEGAASLQNVVANSNSYTEPQEASVVFSSARNLVENSENYSATKFSFKQAVGLGLQNPEILKNEEAESEWVKLIETYDENNKATEMHKLLSSEDQEKLEKFIE